MEVDTESGVGWMGYEDMTHIGYKEVSGRQAIY